MPSRPESKVTVRMQVGDGDWFDIGAFRDAHAELVHKHPKCVNDLRAAELVMEYAEDLRSWIDEGGEFLCDRENGT